MDAFLDALLDTLKLLPFLLVTLSLMEYFEHRASNRLIDMMQRAGRFGPLIGGVLGCVPQCGFSAASAHLYNGGMITAGTLLAVFLSTSDEAIPILLGNPGGLAAVGQLLLVKVLIGVIAGFLLDLLWPSKKQLDQELLAQHKHTCHCDGHLSHIFLAALKRTLSILLFVLIVTLILNLLISAIGEERLGNLLLSNSPLQPVLAGLFGFIPNCAASVLLTELYLAGTLSFGSAIAGLGTSAGVGILILLRGKRSWKTYLLILCALYIAAVIPGMILHLTAL